MNKISDGFYNFLKVSIAVALVLILVCSIGLLPASDFSVTQANIFALTGVFALVCTVAICLKIKTKYKIILILLSAFIVRLVWILCVDTVLVSDYLTVYRAAESFLAGDKGPLRDYGYLARFPHLVPMMMYMMGMIKLFGENATAAMKAVSLILSVVTVYLVYILAGYYVKKPVTKLIAMGIAAIYPSFVAYSSTFCTETIGVPLFILSVILFNKANSQSGFAKYGFLICGIVLYLSNMFRGVGLVFLVAFVLYILFFSDAKKIGSILKLIGGYFVTAVVISTILIGTGVTEEPLWKGKEPSVATLMLKGSNFEHGGAWNKEDAEFVTKNLRDKDLSKKCFRIIAERISERSVPEVIGFYGEKFLSQWSIGDCSGTYWATLNTSVPFPYPTPFAFQLIYVILLTASLPIVLCKRKSGSLLSVLFMLLGGLGILFILLETQARYSYIVNWIFIILAVVGLENIINEDKYICFVKKIYTKYKEKINYLIFGAVTTLVNILSYYVLYKLCHAGNVFSNIVAWFLSVAVAYITNKIWVFESKSTRLSVLSKEIASFFSCRLLTGVFEIGAMWLTVDILMLAPMLMKITISVIVIILNYIVSKAIVFKKNSDK